MLSFHGFIFSSTARTYMTVRPSKRALDVADQPPPGPPTRFGQSTALTSPTSNDKLLAQFKLGMALIIILNKTSRDTGQRRIVGRSAVD